MRPAPGSGGRRRARLAVHPHGTYGPLLPRSHSPSCAATVPLQSQRPQHCHDAWHRSEPQHAQRRRNCAQYLHRPQRPCGFQALALRDAGFTGEADAVASVLGNIYGSAFDPAAATADLNSTWWIRRNYFKRFPAGRYAHGALDLVDDLAAQLGSRLAPELIERIEIETFFLAATMGQQSVRTPFGCRFSIPMLVAQRIAHGSIPLTDDGTHAFADPAVRALAVRVFVSEDKAATAAYPERQPTQMRVVMRDSGTHVVSNERILGESDRPFPSGILEAKFAALTEASLGDAAATAWRDLIGITDIPDVGRLLEGWRTVCRAT